jgi:hypothetical protein
MQATVRGVTLTIERGPDAVRVTVRRAWWTPYGIRALLSLLVAPAAAAIG